MKSNQKKLYLYLARRDKRGIMVLATMTGQPMTSRVDDVSLLQMDNESLQKLTAMVHQNRMEYELWIEAADSFQQLSSQLLSRGFSRLPLASSPMFNESGMRINQGGLSPRKTMTRRKR